MAAAGRATTATAQKKKAESLIARYHLEERAKTVEEIKEEQLGGKAVWEDSAEKREASLRERKAQMILAARQCVLSLSFCCYSLIVYYLRTGASWNKKRRSRKTYSRLHNTVTHTFL